MSFERLRASFRPFRGALAALAVTACAWGSASPAAAQSLRYTTNAPGGIVATGNTLGLSKASNANGPGTSDSIGTFLTLNGGSDDFPLNPGNMWPAGTTNDWTQNGSEAVLALPSEVTVLYAELLWGGSFQYGMENVLGALETPVTLTAGAMSMSVSPDAATALTVSSVAASGFNVRYYLRSADVTSFVKTAGAGMYAVEGVPATQDTNINSLNAAGWTLVVAYRDETAPTRNLSVFVGGSFVDEDSQQDYTVSGFCAPPAGAVTGTAIVSTIEGDASLVGDQLLIAATAAGPFVQLSGPNNPANNFFCSQMNDATGALDTQGTFGASNHNAIAGTNIAGGRQGWDVTTVPLSSANGQLSPGQKSAVLRTITTGDSYMPILASFAIDVNAPKVGGADTKLTADPTEVTLGDTFTLTATLSNTGQVAAQAVTFQLPSISGVSLTAFTSDGATGDINGGTVTDAILAAGVDEGTLAPAGTRTVKATFSVDAEPPNPFLFELATWTYGFEACVGEPLLTETISRSAVVTYNMPTMGTGGAGGGGAGQGGDQGGAGGAGTGANGTGGENTGGSPSDGGGGAGGGDGGSGAGIVITPGGCGCRTAGDAGSQGLWALVGLGMLGMRATRRRRRP